MNTKRLFFVFLLLFAFSLDSFFVILKYSSYTESDINLALSKAKEISSNNILNRTSYVALEDAYTAINIRTMEKVNVEEIRISNTCVLKVFYDMEGNLMFSEVAGNLTLENEMLLIIVSFTLIISATFLIVYAMRLAFEST